MPGIWTANGETAAMHKYDPPPIPGSGSDHILDHIQIRTTWIGRTQEFRKARFSVANRTKWNEKDQKNLLIRLWVHQAVRSGRVTRTKCPQIVY